MRILVTGAGGMLGVKLINRLAQTGKLCGRQIEVLDRHDVVLAPPPPKSSFAVNTFMSDFSTVGEAAKLVAAKPDVIFHLAAIVSGEAEAEFDKGYAINLDGTRLLLEAIRQVGGDYRPRFVFTSSIAVFGAPFPDIIDDEFFLTPLTSYGTQKAICEMLLSDYSRKGFVDGIGLRMPTVCVRPGKPNKAASGFFSNIIREPLAGQEAVLPVSDTVRHWHISPRGAVSLLLHGAELDTSKLGVRRSLCMPGLSCTVAEQLDALKAVAGNDVLKLIRREPDATIVGIVSGWPQNFTAARARELGFKYDKTFADIIRIHMEDELGTK
jgi:D-erythronate 2-dehydrogenase